MGLDQYLYRSDADAPDDWSEATDVAYWRKFNALHAWMERNLNGGESTNCEFLPISLEQLAGLAVTCERIVEQPAMAASALPTEPGFFFGSTEYDDYYLQKAAETAATLQRIIAEEQAHVLAGGKPRRYAYWSWW